jgi:hypothetical protein
MRYHQAEYYKTHVGPMVWGHIAYFNVVTDGICSNHFSVNGKRKKKQRKTRRTRLYKCNYLLGVSVT